VVSSYLTLSHRLAPRYGALQMWQTCSECVQQYEHDRMRKNKPGPTQYWSRADYGQCFMHYIDALTGYQRAEPCTWDKGRR
jgi:hypothetical protein